ncbi:MAG: hypothetical protein IJ560_00290 [Alphaproteobacteria bacterium]|nr:hypothetical protein [Alphaproteobacteria bacterium]
MIIPGNIILYTKYAAAIVILFAVVMAPAWIARQTKKSGYDMLMIRGASWLFLFTGIGWIMGLFWAARK